MDEDLSRDAIIGCILGTAVGDALGLPYEGEEIANCKMLELMKKREN